MEIGRCYFTTVETVLSFATHHRLSKGGNSFDDLSGRTKDRTNTRQGSSTPDCFPKIAISLRPKALLWDGPSNEKRAVPDSSGAPSDNGQASSDHRLGAPSFVSFSPVSLFPHGSSSPLHTTGRFVSRDPGVKVGNDVPQVVVWSHRVKTGKAKGQPVFFLLVDSADMRWDYYYL